MKKDIYVMYIKYNDFINENLFSNIFKSKKKNKYENDEESQRVFVSSEEEETELPTFEIKKTTPKDIDHYTLKDWYDELNNVPKSIKINDRNGSGSGLSRNIYINDTTRSKIISIMKNNYNDIRDMIRFYNNHKEETSNKFYKFLIEHNPELYSEFSKTWISNNYRKNSSLLI